MAPTQQAVYLLKRVFPEPFPVQYLEVGAFDVGCRAVQIYLTPAERT